MISRHCGQGADSHMVSWLPPYHDLGLVCGILFPAHKGFPATLMSPVAFLQRPFRWLQTITNVRGTMSQAPNFAFELCCRKVTAEQRATLDLSSWEVAANGGEPVKKETLERFTALFGPCGYRNETHFPGYGMAETTLIIATSYRLGTAVVKAFQQEALEQHRVVEVKMDTPGSKTVIGYPHMAPDQRVLIVNPETRCICAPDQVGEIWGAGPSITQGYWRKTEETERTFHAYTADTHEGPFVRTGDLGFLHDGALFVTGRAKDVIIIRGHNYYPQDIEHTVEQSHAAIRPGCCAAFSMESEDGEQLVVLAEIDPRYKPAGASQTTDEESTSSRKPLHPQEVKRAIRAAIAEEHELQTHTILLVKAGSVLKTSSGKLQRRACRSAFLAGNMGAWDE
jgi:acyl-CoA synthetase (AMP-forming)/AMP-acid ligase II